MRCFSALHLTIVQEIEQQEHSVARDTLGRAQRYATEAAAAPPLTALTPGQVDVPGELGFYLALADEALGDVQLAVQV